MVRTDTVYRAMLTRHNRDRGVLAVVFLLLFVFSYSEDIVFAVLDATGHDHLFGWIIGLVGFDVAVLTVVGLAQAPDRASRRRRPKTLAAMVDLVRCRRRPRCAVMLSSQNHIRCGSTCLCRS